MSGKVHKTRAKAKSWEKLASEGLADKKEAVAYLEEAFRDGAQMFLLALNRVVSAQGGIGTLAKKTGLSRESLYKLLSGERDARLSSVASILSALEIQVTFGVDGDGPKSKRRLVGSKAA